MNKGMTSGVTQRIRLRRVPTKQELIKRNLSSLEENVRKKQAAQAYYYNKKKENNVGQSPLRRQGFLNNKSSVQNRLGVKSTMIFTNKNQRQNVAVGIQRQPNTNLNHQNTQFIRRKFQNNQGQKIILRNNRNQHTISTNRVNNNIMNNRVQNRVPHNVANNRMQRFTKKNFAQQRLMQIKDSVKTVQNVKKIKLRRNNPQNYKIQVVNGTNMVVAAKPQHSVLNPQLQAEIQAIQKRVPPVEILPTAQSTAAAFGTTTLTLNERFTGLM